MSEQRMEQSKQSLIPQNSNKFEQSEENDQMVRGFFQSLREYNNISKLVYLFKQKFLFFF